MKIGKSLKQKIKGIESKFYGIEEKLQPFEYDFQDDHIKVFPTDVKYRLTKNYKVIAVKWKRHTSWTFSNHVYRDWLAIYYKEKKNDKKKIKEILTDSIETERTKMAGNDSNFEKYECVNIHLLASDKIDVWWSNLKGEKSVTYEINLKTKYVLLH